MSEIINIIKKNKLLVVILAVGFFLRIYKPAELFMYSHDNDLSGWFVKDIVDNRHLRLIGQETSTQGIFIGPIFYYLLVPFYILFGMDPIGGVALITILGMFSIWSFYFVFSRVFTKREGLIAAFLYSISFYTIFNDREVVPTMPVIMWSVWFFYGLDQLLKNNQKKGFLVLGILIGLIWHTNIALSLLLPLIPFAMFLSKKKFDIRKSIFGVLATSLLFLPLILFEFRHGFSQIKWLKISLTTNQQALVSGFDKVKRVFHLLSKNNDGFLWGSIEPFSFEITTVILLGVLAFLVYKKFIKKRLAIIFIAWLLLYFGFFSVYSKILSEYYLNGSLLPFILIITLAISYAFSKKNTKKIGVVALILFAVLNLHRFFAISINKSGYTYRKLVVEEIKRDSLERGYPCVAVSYITSPGSDLGYRYFFYLLGMHVNRPESNSPVYTIVYPLRDDIVHDINFGHIGLIYPDYSRYNEEDVRESCMGENSNLTDPMFGFTN